jgi:hypothetical protein
LRLLTVVGWHVGRFCKTKVVAFYGYALPTSRPNPP